MEVRHVTEVSILTCIKMSLLRAANAAGACETVFKGFSDCLLSLGENVMNHPQDLDDPENLHTICSYWSDFLSCTSAAVADCQDEAVELWEKLKVPSGSLNYRGSLFQLCSKDNGAPGLSFTVKLIIGALTLFKLVMWVIFE
ncbi:hypothetical protein C0J50_23480 [Silurus asotus]|uniref:Neuritin n=1 Tax=Silurus asotus TaxID=30991 RepID=A0AAD5AIR9_SILAS|nr:hypothetical protein C0J50_23480 [Silurus asotus]